MALPRAKSLSFLTCVADTVAAGTRRIEPRRERRARRRRHAALSHGVLDEGFDISFASLEFNVYGAGVYFAPDPKLTPMHGLDKLPRPDLVS